MNKGKRPAGRELLAPAGSAEALRAGLKAGADAVYMGGSRFGARAFAENADDLSLLRLIDEVHLQDKKLYLTVNTLMKQEEMESGLYDFIRPLYEAGLDAAIVQDFGVFSFLKREFPLLPLHVSTQMTVTGPLGGKLLRDAGARRLVLARELSLPEIRAVSESTGIEIECFVHGAVCYCYSGQCLMSSVIGGRSGNRGRCAQPCRLPYTVLERGKPLNKGDRAHVMNLKDMCALSVLPDMLKAGVYSFKIEGRMKSPVYTAGVTSVYRHYLDMAAEDPDGYRVDPEDLKHLSELFDRGGTSDRYFFMHNHRDMIAPEEKPVIRFPDQTFIRGIESLIADPEKEPLRPVRLSAVMSEGTPFCVVAEDVRTGKVFTKDGPEPMKALTRPMTQDDIEYQLMRTGGTCFSPEEISVYTDGDLFLPIGRINHMRRSALDGLKKEILADHRREMPDPRPGANVIPLREEKADAEREEKRDERKPGRPLWSASLEEPSAFETVLAHPLPDIVQIEAENWDPETWKNAADRIHRAGKRAVIALPRASRMPENRFFDENLSVMRAAGFDGFIARNLESLAWLKKNLPEAFVTADASLYAWNREAADFLSRYADRLTLPLEESCKELLQTGLAGAEMIVYGRVPLMISANCLLKTTSLCTHEPGWLKMRDRKNYEMPVRRNCRTCTNVIYNAVPLSLHAEAERIGRLAPSVCRICLTDESPARAKKVLDLFADPSALREPDTVTTKGHFLKGCE